MRVVGTLLVLVAAVALAPQALAKEGVVAHLENPSVLHAPAGSRVMVVWTLRAGKQPFGASGVYIRLRGRVGPTTTTPASDRRQPGVYQARVTIPRGGVRTVVIGLVGWSFGPYGRKRADVFFPITNDPTR